MMPAHRILLVLQLAPRVPEHTAPAESPSDAQRGTWSLMVHEVSRPQRRSDPMRVRAGPGRAGPGRADDASHESDEIAP